MIRFETFTYPNHCLTTFACEDTVTPSDLLSEGVIYLLNKWQVEIADKVIIAYDNNELAGFFRYDLGNDKSNIYAAGTYVKPKFRNKGIALSLWTNMFNIQNPKTIFGYIDSIEGLCFLNKFKSIYPNIKYNFTYNVDISLDNSALSA